MLHQNTYTCVVSFNIPGAEVTLKLPLDTKPAITNINSGLSLLVSDKTCGSGYWTGITLRGIEDLKERERERKRLRERIKE